MCLRASDCFHKHSCPGGSQQDSIQSPKSEEVVRATLSKHYQAVVLTSGSGGKGTSVGGTRTGLLEFILSP